MKKILFLLLVTISSYAQTYQNPTFGTVTTKTAPTVTSVDHLASVGSTGIIGKIDPVNLPFEPSKYTSIKTVGVSGDYTTLENLFLNEPAGKTLIKLIDSQYTCLNPKFVVKNGWIIQGQGYGKTNITFNFTEAIDPALSGLQVRTNCELIDFKVTSVIDTNLGGFSQYALHADYTGVYTAKITRCYFKKISSPNVVDANGGNGLSVGIGTWEGQNIEFRECILEGQGIAVDNKYTLNLHNTFVTTLHTIPSRVSFYNCRLSGGFTTVLISDVYSRDSDPNANRVKDLFEFVGTEIKGGLWLRSKSVSGTIDKKNGLNFNFSGSSVDEFLNTAEIVDTSLSNYDFSSLPVTSDVEYHKNLGVSTINAGDFVSYVYANRLPEYHLTSEKTINTIIGVEKLTSTNINKFAGISLVSSAVGNYLHFAKGAIAYSSETSTTLDVGDNVTFSPTGGLIKSWFGGIGTIRKKTYDNRLGIELNPKGIKTNIIGSETTRGVLAIEGKSDVIIANSMHPAFRIKDYNGDYSWQQTVGVKSNPGVVEVGRFAISDLKLGLERFGISSLGAFTFTGSSLSVQNNTLDADPNSSLILGTVDKPGIFRLVSSYNSGDGFKLTQDGAGLVSFGATPSTNTLYITPTYRLGVNINAPISTFQAYQSDAALPLYAGFFSTKRNGLAVFGDSSTTASTDILLGVFTGTNPASGSGASTFAMIVRGNGKTIFGSSTDTGELVQINGTAKVTGILTAPTAVAGTNTTQVATTAFVQAALPTSGTYTPTLTAVTNIASFGTIYPTCHYTRVGNIVNVTVHIVLNTTAATTASEFELTFPVNKTVSGTLNRPIGIGLAQSSGYADAGMHVKETATTTKAKVTFTSTPTPSMEVSLTFSYYVGP
jgi:hypothetical protein